MNIGDYLDTVRAKYASGQATEHSYRAALEGLFQSIDPTIEVINEPKKSEGGMPDFLFQRNGVAFGWAEAKDIDKDVIKLKGYSVEQRKRYENAYPNLIYTNGVDFQFIRDKEVVHLTSIADFMGQLGGLKPLPDNFAELERQLKNFAQQKPISIRSAQKLAEMMAGKAAIIKDEVGIALADDPEFRSGLGGQYKSFKQNLLPNLTPGEFADIYAETITYGMFAARLHDDTLETFSRAEALEKLPKSNPFLKGLFEYIAGAALPKRLRYIVDDLAEVLRASDPHSLFEDFGKFTARNDPFIHFYETFLAAYNPKKRKSRGVWYTPEPVVDFIVRAVDDVLKTEFGLADGLADTSKVTVDWDTGQDDPKTGKPRTIKKEVHKVQILDPATGTGTFLAKAVQTIADRVKARAPGKWSNYVEEDLLPRLHGFELLMASYAMCHMKLDMMLTETGYRPSINPPRLSVWLTNALEPAEREVRDLFFQPLAEEARGASEVKRQSPIMCVIGNPPYSGESANKGKHIMDLMEAYKMEPGGKERLKERNPKWLFGYGGVGVCSKRDGLAYHEKPSELREVLRFFDENDEDSVKAHFQISSESRDQKVSFAKEDISDHGIVERYFQSVQYRPFDRKVTYLTGRVRGFLAYPVNDLSRNFSEGRSNFGIVTGRQGQAVGGNAWNLAYLTSETVDLNIYRRGGGITFPLYLYPDETAAQADALAPTERTLNLDPKLFAAICKAAGIDPADQAGPEDDFRAPIGDARPSEVKVFDYIYGVLHSPDYRATFAEFLKIDFPRIPYPASPEVFAHVSEKGEQLRRLHLMEAPAIGDTPYPYHGDGDDIVASGYPKFKPSPLVGEGGGAAAPEGEGSAASAAEKTHSAADAAGPSPQPSSGEDGPRQSSDRPGDDRADDPTRGEGDIGRVYINSDQYFADVPAIAWNFHIGGYQPAQKWLKDRKGRSLSWDDIGHYQKIVKILIETDRIMKQIELPLDLEP